MANISAIKLPDGYTYTIVDNTSGWTSNEGTVTSVRVQASSPVQSSVSTEQNTSLNTTISLADGYGDTKNPYASKTKNYVLAAPSNANGVPSFRALVAADIPDLSGTYLTSYTETDPIFLASAAHGITASDITNWNNKTSNTGTVKKVTAGVGLNTTSNDTATDGGDITTTGTLYLTKSGATAGSYGDSGNQTPSYGSTFKVPYITVDKYGRVTAITEHTVKIPASDNTNTTYNLSNALASHKFTETLTAGGSGSGTSTATMEFAAGTGISLQDDTTNKKLTIGNTGVTSITTAAGSHSIKSSATGAVSFNVPTNTSHLTNDSDYTTKTYVDTAIANLPEPMIFKGSLGTDGTITTLPAAASTNEGYTYKVISDGTYASQTAKIGDTFISDGSNWILIPSGDEPSGTVTSVKVQGSNGLTGSGTVTSSGTITISHATGTGTSSSNSGRTYIQSVTLDSYGHVTGLTTATETVTNSDTKNTAGSNDTSSKIFLVGTTSQTTGSNALQTYSHDTAYVGTDGCLYSGGSKVLTSHQSLANYVPTSRTVNGKALSADISLTAADVGAATSDHTHTTSLAAGGTSTVSLAANTAYTLTAGGTSVVFTTPPDNNSWRPVENVLNSDSTTNSLSAAQGKALANGSARDSTKLPLTGGTMTGQILINNVAGPKINSNNIDLKVWEVVGNSGSWNSEFGFHELYKGTGSGNDNTLELYAHNQAGTHVKVRTIKQDGTVTWHTAQTFTNTIQGSITGSAGSVAWSGVTSKPNLVNTITTTAGAHTAITSKTGDVSFNVPTTAAHVGIKFGYTTSGNNRAVLQDSSGNLYVTQKDDNTWRGIQDNLNSTSATDSLSANQGKILNESKLSLTGGNVTGPVTFGDSVEIDEATIGDLIVNGNGNFTNNLQVNTINGVAVGSSPKFTDTLMTVSSTGEGNAIASISASGNVITVTKATYSNNAGTVTKVTAGTGLSIGTTAQGEFTTSGTINHTNSVTAQTTQAIYPIKIDAQGHISAYGSAVTPLTASSTLDATKLSGTIPSGCYTDNDTKNTAGSNDTSSKIFLVGTTQQTTSSNALQTYSHDTAYVGTDGCLYSGGEKVLTSHQSLSGYVPTSRTINGKALTGNITLNTSKTATLSTTWSSNQQTISVTEVTASNTVIVTPAPASYNMYCECGVYCSAQAANSLTFTCDEVPTSSLTVNIVILS